MKYIKMLSLLAVAAAALMAFAGTASATTLDDSEGAMGVGDTIEASLEKGTSAALKAGFATITCTESGVNGHITNAGGSGQAVSGTIDEEGLTFNSCNATVTVLNEGSLSITHTSGSNGSLSSTGAEVTVAIGSTSCVYGTPTAKTIGPVTGGTPATLKAEASLSRISGGFLCANPATWTANYIVTNPGTLTVTS
jgi:hypothetical protein